MPLSWPMTCQPTALQASNVPPTRLRARNNQGLLQLEWFFSPTKALPKPYCWWRVLGGLLVPNHYWLPYRKRPCMEKKLPSTSLLRLHLKFPVCFLETMGFNMFQCFLPSTPVFGTQKLFMSLCNLMLLWLVLNPSRAAAIAESFWRIKLPVLRITASKAANDRWVKKFHHTQR